MNRAEHLQWAKKRAIALIDRGELKEGFLSFMSDLNKHEELRGLLEPGASPGSDLFLGGPHGTAEDMREWIGGFN